MSIAQQLDALTTSVDALKGALATKWATLIASVGDEQSATARAQAAKPPHGHPDYVVRKKPSKSVKCPMEFIHLALKDFIVTPQSFSSFIKSFHSLYERIMAGFVAEVADVDCESAIIIKRSTEFGNGFSEGSNFTFIQVAEAFVVQVVHFGKPSQSVEIAKPCVRFRHAYAKGGFADVNV